MSSGAVRTEGTASLLLAPLASLVLALAAAGLFALARAFALVSGPAETLLTGGIILGCALLVWAVIVGIAALVGLLRRRRSGWAAPLVLAASALVIAGILIANPLVGSGSGGA